MKSSIVCVYGCANAGKSSLINRILGFKILPISDKPQTTRDTVKAIYNDEDCQLVFVDTPGIFKPHKRFGEILLRNAENAKYGVDVILYVVDLSKKLNYEITQKLASSKEDIIVAFNKIDLVKYDKALEIINEVKKILQKAEYVEISCKENVNIDKVINLLKTHLKHDYLLFNDDIVLDRPKEYVITEIIREKCMRLLSKELPHAVYIQLDKLTIEEKLIEVYSTIIVEKDGEKSIVIGKGGRMIKEISRLSETSIYAYFKTKTICNLVVKVVDNWRSKDKYLKQYGFLDD